MTLTRADFERYIAAFNASDFGGFSAFYTDDVDFRLGSRKHIVGRQGIVDFYRGVKDHLAEELTILDLLVAPDGFCLHNRTRFTAIKDWPDFELWPIMKGDTREHESIILYRTRGDRFCSIKSARFLVHE